jgi:hypothetical protein
VFVKLGAASILGAAELAFVPDRSVTLLVAGRHHGGGAGNVAHPGTLGMHLIARLAGAFLASSGPFFNFYAILES